MCVSTRIPFDNKLSEMQIGGEHLSFPVIRFWFRRADCGGRDDRRSGWLYGRHVYNDIVIDYNNVHHESPRHSLRSLPSSHPRSNSALCSIFLAPLFLPPLLLVLATQVSFVMSLTLLVLHARALALIVIDFSCPTFTHFITYLEAYFDDENLYFITNNMNGVNFTLDIEPTMPLHINQHIW